MILIPYLISGLSGAVFLPTKKEIIKEAIELAGISSNDKVIDLGSGDGRFLFEVYKRCANVTGVEIQPLLVTYSKIKNLLQFNNDINILLKNIWLVDLSKYNVIFVFLSSTKMKKLEEKIKKETHKGTKIISYAFKLPGLKPKKKTKSGLYLYQIT